MNAPTSEFWISPMVLQSIWPTVRIRFKTSVLFKFAPRRSIQKHNFVTNRSDFPAFAGLPWLDVLVYRDHFRVRSSSKNPHHGLGKIHLMTYLLAHQEIDIQTLWNLQKWTQTGRKPPYSHFWQNFKKLKFWIFFGSWMPNKIVQ